MGDIRCLNCKEPWDAYHMKWDAIGETNLRLPKQGPLAWKGTIAVGGETEKLYREAFRKAKYEFGADVLILERCPACWDKGETPKTTKQKVMAMNAIANILGDDQDALQVEMEDMDLWGNLEDEGYDDEGY